MRTTPLDVTDRDIEIIKGQLLNRRITGHMECLEWGAGGSTIYFPALMEQHGVPYRWTSIEHSEEWYLKVLEAVKDNPNIELNLCKSDNPRRSPMDHYTGYPFKMGKRFDFVFVDGRRRRRCLLTASKLTAPAGVVVLHDARREYYHSAFDAFTSGERVGDDLWIGRIDAL